MASESNSEKQNNEKYLHNSERFEVLWIRYNGVITRDAMRKKWEAK